MRLPNHIRSKLVSANNHALRLSKIMSEVDTWLEARGYHAEDLRDGSGRSLEEFEYGNGDVDAFERFLDGLKTNV